MKKRIIIIIAVLAVAGVFFTGGMMVGAATYEPGTQGDPIVTLSYLNARLAEVGALPSDSADDSQLSTAPSSFTQVKLSAGEQLVLQDGGMVIVYSGNGSIIGTSGLMNLSTSDLFPAGTSAVLYSLYLAMGSSSGIKASGNMTVYVLGDYSIK